MKLADVFCDHMILQREKPIVVFGEGEGEGAVRFRNEEVAFTAHGPFWVTLPPQQSGGPDELTVTVAGECRVIRDVLVGDVFLAGGQSNMEMMLKETGESLDALAPCPGIRLFREPHGVDETLRLWKDEPQWFAPDGRRELDFSAVGYWFARRLANETGVPIGIISCNKGASRVDAWTDPERLAREPYAAMLREKHRDYTIYPFNRDSLLYRTKLLPLVPFAMAGVIWYQGESNRGMAEARHYRDLFACMVENWRELWADALPFYTVQLMPFAEDEGEANWWDVRLGQLKAAQSLEGVAMTTLFQTGEEEKIHPQQKRCVGEALAGAVLWERDGKPVEYCGPLAQEATFEDKGVVRVRFTHGEDMRFTGGTPEDTFLYDADGAQYPVSARVEGDTVIFCHEGLRYPCRITMGMCNVPRHNLHNRQGFVASPFEFRR